MTVPLAHLIPLSLQLPSIELPLANPVAIFFVVLVVILVAPLLLHKLRIPNIVGMILAGILIGPHALNLIDRDASFEIFGQVGILYLMFLAGVEIDMLNLKRNWKAGLQFGLLSFILPFAGGVAVSYYLLDCSLLTSFLIASMLASHTLISYPIVSRFGLNASRASVIAVCGTIAAVLLALIVLAEVVDVKYHGTPDWGRVWILVISIVFYAKGIQWAFTAATRWFLRRFSDRVLQFIFILAEVLLAALLAQLIGLEGILGAFYAGLVLNRFIPYRSGLMNRIEFVGNAIFIPYFLIGVGMLMDVGVIISGWSVIRMAVCMTLTALLLKWLAAFIQQKLLGLGAGERRLMFGLTSGKAAATIAATIIGYKYGLISEDVMNGAVIMILACCAVASVVTERAARKLRLGIAERELKKDPKAGFKYARQLVAVANPMTSAGLMRLALLMRRMGNTNPICALFVRNSDDATLTNMGREAMKDALKSAESADVPVQEIERYDTNTVTGITNVIKERNCTEVIIGLHRKANIVDTFYGSMIEQLLSSTNLMVIMSRCYVPVNTLQRMVVVVPEKAQFETGFRLWVARIGMLSSQIGCRLVFVAYPDTARFIGALMTQDDYHVEVAYSVIHSWEDFIALSGNIDDDDLLVMVSARSTSLSYSPDLETMPAYLSRYFSRQNLLVIYPEQFGAETDLPAPLDTLSSVFGKGAPAAKFSFFRRRRGWQ